MKSNKNQETNAEVKITVTDGYLILNLHLPYRWLILLTTAILAWQIPELWKAIELVLPLLSQ